MAMQLKASHPRGGRWPGILAGLAILLLVVAVLMMAGAGPAYRGELISLGEAFNLLRNGVYAAGGAVAVSIVTLLLSILARRFTSALMASLVIIAAAALLFCALAALATCSRGTGHSRHHHRHPESTCF